jgi:hypothetical protein
MHCEYDCRGIHLFRVKAAIRVQALKMANHPASMQAGVFDAPGGPEVLHTTLMDAQVPHAMQARLRCETVRSKHEGSDHVYDRYTSCRVCASGYSVELMLLVSGRPTPIVLVVCLCEKVMSGNK